MKLGSLNLAVHSVRDLEQTSRDLEREIHKLDKRGSHLTPPEWARAAELKKVRLLAKDRLADLRAR